MIDSAIYNALKDDAQIATKVADGSDFHIYPLEIPDGALTSATEGSRYFIVYQLISEINRQDVDLRLPLYQITVIADRYTNAIALKDDIIRVLERFKGNLGSQQDVMNAHQEGMTSIKDPETDYYHIPLSFRFKYLGDNV